MAPETLAPPSVPPMTQGPPQILEADPLDDIADPPVPEAAAPPSEWQHHEALLQGFLSLVQGRLKAWIEEEHKALQAQRGVCDLEHQRLCQSLEAVTKLAQQAVTTSQQVNEHAWYGLGDSLLKLHERGVQLHHDPYRASVQAVSPHGFLTTIYVAKSEVSELISALPALTGWLAQEGYKPLTKESPGRDY